MKTKLNAENTPTMNTKSKLFELGSGQNNYKRLGTRQKL